MQGYGYVVLYTHPQHGELAIQCRGELPQVGEELQLQHQPTEMSGQVRLRGQVEKVIETMLIVLLDGVEIL